MFILSLLSVKGGVGKSTLSINLAVAFQKAGKNTLILDLDPQASSTEWHDARTDPLPHVESITPARLRKTVESAKDIGTDILIIDTAPHSESTALDAARLSDLVLVPVQPSIMDIRAVTKTIDLLKLTQARAFAIINGVQHSSLGAATEAEKTIERVLGLPVCPVRVFERVAFNRSLITGLSAQEFEPDGKAAREVKKLHQWMTEQMP